MPDESKPQNGGARKGAGRKKGGTNKKTREIAMRVAAEGITPLEVMVLTMRTLWKSGHYTAASAIAKDAAPYMHSRLQTTTINGHADVTVRDNGTDRPPRENREEWFARRDRDLAASLGAMPVVGTAD